MNLPRTLLSTLVVLPLLLAGCTGSNGGGDFVTPDQDGEGRYVIRMTSALRFVPENAEVPAGATVIWVHEGGGLHDTVAQDGTWTSGLLEEGDSFEVTLDGVGEHRYHCNPHRAGGMVGVLRVAEA